MSVVNNVSMMTPQPEDQGAMSYWANSQIFPSETPLATPVAITMTMDPATMDPAMDPTADPARGLLAAAGTQRPADPAPQRRYTAKPGGGGGFLPFLTPRPKPAAPLVADPVVATNQPPARVPAKSKQAPPPRGARKNLDPPPMTQTESTGSGPHTGERVAELPVDDLKKPKGGSWEGKVNFKASSLVNFEGKSAVKVFYKKGSGTSSMPHSNAAGVDLVAQNKFIKGQTALVVSFEVYFDPKNWNFSRGGKMAGISVGPGVASGFRHSVDGASHRIMWQAGGGAISYIYPPAKMKQEDPKLKPEGHGVGYFGDKFPAGTLKVGQWNRIELGVKVNTFTNGKPNPDGKSQLTINGVSGVLTNVRWAARPDIKIDAFGYGSFFGGPSPAVVDSVSYIRNFSVHKWKD